MRCFISILSALALAGLLCGQARAADKKLVLIVSDQITLKELNDPGVFRNFHRAVKQGALGLMITQPPAGFDPSGGYATLGAGRPVIGAPGAGNAFNLGETPPEGSTVLSTYVTRMAEKPPVDRIEILHLGLPALMRANGGPDSGIGALGEALWKSDITTCVYGNADFRGTPHREAALIGMNARGQVERGDVAWADLRKVEALPPFQSTADLDKLKDVFYEDYLHDFNAPAGTPPCDFIVIDLGDTRRAEMFRETAAPDVADSRKREALGRLDRFLGFVISAVDIKTTQVMLVSPAPPVDSFLVDETMTPALIVGGGMKHGLLSSPATRRKGLIRNTDIARHILDYFGVPVPASMEGGTLRSERNGNAVAGLLRLQFMDAMRLRVGRVGHAAVMLALLMTGLAFLTVLRMPRVARSWLVSLGVGLCLAAALFPALLFSSVAFMNLFGTIPVGFLHYVGLIAGFTLVLGLLAALLPGAEWRVLSLSLLYVIVLVVDAALAFVLSRNSVLVPSPQFGLRFYGMHNVLAGFLIGGGLTAAGVGLDLLRDKASVARWAVMPLLLVLAAVIGLPVLGANYGALLPACAAFVVFCVAVFRRRYRWTEALATAAVAALLFACFAALTALVLNRGGAWPGSQSMAMLQQSGGFHELTRVIVWRAASNLAELRAGGVWSMLFLVLAACAVMLVYFPNTRAEALFRRFTNIRFALLAALGGAAVSFVLLAGGVGPAAAMLFMPAIGVLALSVTPMKKKPRARKKTGDDKPLSLFRSKRGAARPDAAKDVKSTPATAPERKFPEKKESEKTMPAKSSDKRPGAPASGGKPATPGDAENKNRPPRKRSRPPRGDKPRNRPQGKPVDSLEPEGKPSIKPGGEKGAPPPRGQFRRNKKPRGGNPGGGPRGNRPPGGGGNKPDGPNPGGGRPGGNKPGGGRPGGGRPGGGKDKPSQGNE